MQIQTLGLSCFKITTKEATVIIDPYGKESGFTQPRGIADIVILSEPTNALYSGYTSLSGDPFLINSPGEYDRKGVTIAGIPIKHGDTYITIWLLENEGVKVLDLSHINNFSVSEDDLNSLGSIDILLVPVGGGQVLDGSTAAKITNQIEPAIAIPSHYKTSGCTLKLETADQYLKDLGNKFETVDKLTAKKKDFALVEGTSVYVLETAK
jgi:L-ascorbate metabolism protein UlaG (beta-lactamase superfamily)